ncbi:hypothetical protein D3C85_223480 [compost metagenome]
MLYPIASVCFFHEIIAFLESALFLSTLKEATGLGFAANPFPKTLKSEIANKPDAL